MWWWHMADVESFRNQNDGHFLPISGKDSFFSADTKNVHLCTTKNKRKQNLQKFRVKIWTYYYYAICIKLITYFLSWVWSWIPICPKRYYFKLRGKIKKKKEKKSCILHSLWTNNPKPSQIYICFISPQSQWWLLSVSIPYIVIMCSVFMATWIVPESFHLFINTSNPSTPSFI